MGEKVIVTDTNLTNIANSIRSKLGVQTTYKPRQMSAAIDSIETGSGLEINGTIKEYCASSSINRGDFVYLSNTFKTLSSYPSNAALVFGYNTWDTKVVELNDSQVFVVTLGQYRVGLSLITINGDTYSRSYTEISGIGLSNSEVEVDAVKLSDDKVFIAYAKGSDRHIEMRVCTISNNQISTNTAYSITQEGSGRALSLAKLSSSKVFVACSAGGDTSTYWWDNYVCTISGTTITVGDKYPSDTEQESGKVISAVALDSSNVCVIHRKNLTYSYVYARNFYISGTTVNAYSTDTGLWTTPFSDMSGKMEIATVLLDTSKLVYAYTGSQGRLYIGVHYVNGSSFLNGGTSNFSPGDGSQVRDLIKLNEHSVLLLYSKGDSAILSGRVFVINGKNCTAYGNEITFSDGTRSGIRPSAGNVKNKLFITYVSDSFYNYTSGKLLLKSVRTDNNLNSGLMGVANTSGTTNGTIEVYTPNT